MDRELRLEELQTVLEYCTAKNKSVFSIGERICINQERGILMNDDVIINRPFEYSKKMQSKIDFTLSKIENQKII
ncbi:hypothetical protein QWY99_12530 [Flavobacterium branchiarum]|uniref:Uncharacterized protein n=1 Tax=Flavobacterium branchiarum TaxID=1114870 RepID=A0ABV5FHF9_9FLAO|nr:hypothetical protein [Flavobacterium branchiarum]MDN3673877.1 hypothetical protein [Flavobacterium branchiarum]